MRFPSLALLADQALVVLRRFPWTLAAGVAAAAAGIAATTTGADEAWARMALVAALGFPVTIAITLLAETRGWSAGARHLTIVAGLLGLVGFYFAWPGVERRYEAIRYLQLSAALHFAVAFLPFVGAPDSGAFWQYNRRLFLGFLRAFVFSGVLFFGIAIALGALDKLFGVKVEAEAYIRVWLILALVANTWIFLATVPTDLLGLAEDREYPRALKVFSQYILTPLVFTYLIILLAYLIKIVAGGEWPSGWIGWLVASVSVSGLLGFLLVHPLRTDPAEGWIRTYARWLFIGLVPAALMLLVAFWKRIVPYGLTEPRTLGLLLGFWLLGIALLFAFRGGASIRIIPITLAILLLATLYGPASLTRVSISSQGKRLARMLHPDSGEANAREASAALRFLLDHGAGRQIARRIGRPLPPIDWKTITPYSTQRDSIAKSIMHLAGATYVIETGYGANNWFHLSSSEAVAVTGYSWMVPVASGDATTRVLQGDTVRVISQSSGSGVARIMVGADTLVFDLRPVAQRYADSLQPRTTIPSALLLVEGTAGRRKSALALSQLSGTRTPDSVSVGYWIGSVLVGE